MAADQRALLKSLTLGHYSVTYAGRLNMQLMVQGRPTTAGSSPAPPVISSVREVTISTDKLDESVEFYGKHFGYRIVTKAELNEQSWRDVWQLPRGTIARAVLMRVPGYEEGAFRLVEFRPTSKVFIRVPFRPLDTGHAGCDMTVPDLKARLTAMVDEGYSLASPLFSFVPPNTQATVTEAIALGPTGERLPMVYYKQLGSAGPEPPSPTYAPVVSTFQGIDSDIEQEAAFYRELGLQVTRDRSFDLPEVNEAIGLPHDLRFRSIQLAHPDAPYGRLSLAQFLNYRGRNVSDRSDPPNLGILMVSFRALDFEELIRRLKGLGAYIVAGPEQVQNPIYGSARVITVKRPNGAWLEFYG
jgi:catechol 2,3-dioxygenase-like lactoylglutathione lyase family enzyme